MAQEKQVFKGAGILVNKLKCLSSGVHFSVHSDRIFAELKVGCHHVLNPPVPG